MRKIVFLAGLVCALNPAFGQTARPAQNCDRECLRGMLTSYLSALVAHDPKASASRRERAFHGGYR